MLYQFERGCSVLRFRFYNIFHLRHVPDGQLTTPFLIESFASNKAALTFALKSAEAASGHRNVAKSANVAFYLCRNGSFARQRLVRSTGLVFIALGFSYPERKL